MEDDAMRLCLTTVMILTCCCLSVVGQDRFDVVQVVLDSVGLTRNDIGYRPKGYWNRFPLDIPYRLTSFDDLFAEPLKLYDYSKTMAAAAEKYLEADFRKNSSLSLYYLTYSLGIDRKLGGFRDFSANLIPVADSVPLENAFRSIFDLAYEESLYPSFADRGVSWSEVEDIIRGYSNKMPDRTEKVLARLVLNVGDIIRWRNHAFRNCNPNIMERIFDIDSLPLTQPDGMKYHPEMDDIARCIDYPSLHCAALKAAAIVEETADSLVFFAERIPANLLDLPTPYGRVNFYGSSSPKRASDLYNALLTVDFGTDNTYTGFCGANSNISNPVSLLIDLGGNDSYISPDDSTRQAAGIMGIGVLYDVSGNDVYIGGEYAQGAGLFGVGIHYDETGNDEYKAELSGQGCGYFGVGLCFDADGDDSYYIYGSGQGFGGVGGGVGVLVDYAGDDFYKGEPSPDIFDMADYHSDMKINGNCVQGVGFGRRGDLTDGHSWAGGMGAIIDIRGDDHYLSGNWSLGCAYWFSTGVAYDGKGDDIYESCYFTQGSGAHFCNGILIDEGGNDKHQLFETAGAALGFGWDFANALLINIGGDDSYRANMISLGTAERRSNAFLIDIGGNDTYQLRSGTLGLGAVDYLESYFRPGKLSVYFTDARSLGCFIDIGGNDAYFSFTDSSETIHSRAANGAIWYTPDKTDKTYGADNYGIGIDIDDGIIPEIERWKK
jgi:hypothetical protein